MSKYYCSSAQTARPLVTPLRVYFPWVTGAGFILPFDASSAIPPHALRKRSRGRHHPGSGAYFCSHITPIGGVSGFRNGNSILISQLDRTLVEGRNGEKTWYTYTQGLWTVENYRPTYGTHYYFEQYTLNRSYGQPHFDRTRWSYNVGSGVVDYELAKARAFASEPTRTASAIYWNTTVSNPRDLGNEAKFQNNFVEDQIREGTIPNLGSYLNDAYIVAFESLPHISTNNIANILSIYQLLGSALNTARVGRLVDSVGSLQDAWLGYRYQFLTTKADIQEIVGYADRMRVFSHMSKATGHGSRTIEVGGSRYTFKCALEVSVEDYLGIYSDVERYGLALDGYNAWDLIPYSFMVDWFLHIGDMLETARTRNYAMRMKSSAAWYSMTHTFRNVHGCDQCDYYRWPGHFDPTIMPSTLLQHREAKGSTWVKRGADAVCLLL